MSKYESSRLQKVEESSTLAMAALARKYKEMLGDEVKVEIGKG